MKNQFLSYVAAFFLSCLIHLIFMTGAEAAIFLSRQFGTQNASAKFVFIELFKTAQVPVVHKETARPPVTETAPKTKIIPQKQIIPNSVLPQEMQKFQSSQKQMNQRIQSIKKDLKKQLKLKSVSSSITDMQKVPTNVQKDLLPDYLKSMRLRVTEKWLSILGTVRCASCIAMVEFQIDLLGNISDSKLVYSSEDRLFDQVCLEAIQAVHPLEPFPFQLKSSEDRYLTVALTFYFEQKKK